MLKRCFGIALLSVALSMVSLAQQIGPDDALQMRYAAHLDIADSVVNMTNAGTSGGSLCANLYTFDPAEELISCCTCTITPGALQSLSVLRSLTSNTLTFAIPTAVVVKIVASSSGACNAASITSDSLAPGLRAWATTIHQSPTAATSYSITETPFSTATLVAPELNHLTSYCGFIQAIGSGYGICQGCVTNGLGATTSTM